MGFLDKLGREISRPFKQARDEYKRINSVSDIANNDFLRTALLGPVLGTAADPSFHRKVSQAVDDLDGLLGPQGGYGESYQMPQQVDPWNPQGGYGFGPSPREVLNSYFGNSSAHRPETQAYQSPFGPSPFAGLNNQVPQAPQRAESPQSPNQDRLMGVVERINAFQGLNSGWGRRVGNNKGPAMRRIGG